MLQQTETLPQAKLPPASLLFPYVIAVCASSLASWLLLWVMTNLASTDVTGTVEPLMPLLRLGIVATPVTVALRAATLAFVAWAAIAALGGTPRFLPVVAAVLVFLPILEAPVFLDALATYVSRNTTPTHVPIGLDVLIEQQGGPLWMVARGANLAMLLWAGLVGRALMRLPSVSRTQAILATSAAAIALLILPLVSRT